MATRKRLWMFPASVSIVEFAGDRLRWFLPHTLKREPANTRANGLAISATNLHSIARTKWARWRPCLVILTTEPRISIVIIRNRGRRYLWHRRPIGRRSWKLYA